MSFDQYGGLFSVCGSCVEVYKPRKAQKIAKLGVGSEITDMKFGPKNKYILLGTADGALKVFK